MMHRIENDWYSLLPIIKGADATFSVNATKLSSAAYTATVFIDGAYTGNKFNNRNTVLPTSGFTLKFSPAALPAYDATLLIID